MPIKLIKAIPIKPVMMYVIPNPLSAGGIFEYLIFSLIAAIATIAKNHPTPEPKPYTVASVIFEKSFSCINNEAPRIAQFTAISGKKIPSDP